MGQRYDFLGNKVGGEVKISQFASGVQLDAEATTLTNGNIAVIFHDNLSGGVLTNDIYVRVFDPALNFIRTDNIYVNGLLSSSPSITALPDGTQGLGNNQYGYSFTLFFGGNDDLFYGWAAKIKLAGLTPDQNQSEVASLPDGEMIMVYQDGSAGNHDIYLYNFLPSIDIPVAGAADATADETKPDIAVLTGGRFVVVWTDSANDGNGSGIGASIYTSTNSLVQSFLVNTSVAGNQHDARVTKLADGSFVVVWDD